MSGLIEQLQYDAVDPSTPVSSLLRKVKIAAVKLSLNDALIWVQNELGGYKALADVPDYRKGMGETVGFNPYHGWQPVHFHDHKTSEIISSIVLIEPVANYEALLDKGGGPFRLPLPAETVSLLNESFSFDVPRVANNIPRGLFVGVIQQVRDRVLDWSLELSRAGITGDGMSFTMEEKQKAIGAHISIGTFNGSFSTGDATGSNARINQGSVDNSVNTNHQSVIFDEIALAVRDGVADAVARKSILAANEEMKKSSTPAGFLGAYQRFVNAAADHMTVITPFLPALTGMIPS